MSDWAGHEQKRVGAENEGSTFVYVFDSKTKVAERGGFEPPIAFQLFTLSRRAR
jgi:hypothetical protein